MTGHIGQSGDRHADRILTIRPGEELRQAAFEVLRQRGLTAQDYMVACLTALVADPDRQIEAVARHWPEPKPKGRPRKKAGGALPPPDASLLPPLRRGDRSSAAGLLPPTSPGTPQA